VARAPSEAWPGGTSEAPMQRGNEASGNEPCPGRSACHSPCSPRPGIRPHCCPLFQALFSGRGPFRSGDLLLAFLSFTPAHRSARAPRSFTRSCTSYTRSLTCHNLLFRHLPFSRQPTHPSTRTSESSAIYTRPRPVPIRTHCPICKTHSSPLGFDYSTPILGFLPCAFPTTWRARLPLRHLCAHPSAPIEATGQ
jgi:hypothetical protein